MANQQRPPDRERFEQRYEENGVAPELKREAQRAAPEMQRQAERLLNTRSPEMQGYLLMGGGALLLLFSLGMFPILRWVIVAASIGMIIVGAMRSNAMTTVSDYFERMRSRR
ncbi:hypothetical protein H0X06_06325 [Candidatus Dependentiae bacterium]|nr:hypothetical protein [Candidatus Dependentiae bacterium]